MSKNPKSQNSLLEILQVRPSKEFWDNKDFISIVDMVAEHYGVLPTDLLQLSIYDFSLNVAIFIRAIEAKQKPKENEAPLKGISGFDIRSK